MRMFKTRMKVGGVKRFQQMCERAFAIIARTKEGGISVKGLAGRTGYTIGVAEIILWELVGSGRVEECGVEDPRATCQHYRTKSSL